MSAAMAPTTSSAQEVRVCVTDVRVLIADDEPLVRTDLRELIAGRSGVEVAGEARDGLESLRLITELQPDVVFLDIRMPHLSGLDVMRSVEPEHRPLVVFVTAHDEYALPAFDLHAVDYLTKPFDAERFDRAFDRVLERLDRGRGRLGQPFPEIPGLPRVPLTRLAVRRHRRAVVVDLARVIWFEGADNYVRLHLAGSTEITRRSMADLEQLLDPTIHVRVSRSAIINLGHLKELRPTGHGGWEVLLDNGTLLPLTRSYRDALHARLGGIA